MKLHRALMHFILLTSVGAYAAAQTGKLPVTAHDRAVYLVPVAQVDGPHICLANDLIGAHVATLQGETFAKVEDVVVHPWGEVAYAVLSTGGMLGIGEKWVAVPWSALSCAELVPGFEPKNQNKDQHDIGPDMRDRSRERVTLLISKERLKNAPSMDKHHWPEVADLAWAADPNSNPAAYSDFSKADAWRTSEDAGRPPSTLYKLSDLKGVDVETPSGSELGDVENVGIDLNGRVSYVVVEVENGHGETDVKVGVPWSALTLEGSLDKGVKVVGLSMTKGRLNQAPEVKPGKDNRPELTDTVWLERVYAFYSAPPYWTHAVWIGN